MGADVTIPAGLNGFVAGTVGVLELGRERLKEIVAKYGPRDLAATPLGFSNSISTLVVHVCAAEIRMAHKISGTEIPAKLQREFMLDEPPSPLPMPVGESAASLAAKLDTSREILLGALSALTDADLDREIELRKQSVTVRRALSMLANHQANHFGHIQMLAIQLAPTGAM